MGLFKRDKRITQTVKRAKSARAVYVSPDIQRIELDIDTTDGEIYRFDMSPHIAHEMARSTLIAYSAIFPRSAMRQIGSNWD